MPEEKINQEFWLENVDETRNCFVEEINQNELMSKKRKKKIEHLLILISTVTGCVSISDFASLVIIPIGITSPTIGLNFCVITAGIEKYMGNN